MVADGVEIQVEPGVAGRQAEATQPADELGQNRPCSSPCATGREYEVAWVALGSRFNPTASPVAWPKRLRRTGFKTSSDAIECQESKSVVVQERRWIGNGSDHLIGGELHRETTIPCAHAGAVYLLSIYLVCFPPYSARSGDPILARCLSPISRRHERLPRPPIETEAHGSNPRHSSSRLTKRGLPGAFDTRERQQWSHGSQQADHQYPS